MGDCQNEDLRVQFDRRLKLKFLGSQVTTDAGLLAYRELDETLGLTQIDAESLHDSRLGSNKQHMLVPLLRHRSARPMESKRARPITGKKPGQGA